MPPKMVAYDIWEKKTEIDFIYYMHEIIFEGKNILTLGLIFLSYKSSARILSNTFFSTSLKFAIS